MRAAALLAMAIAGVVPAHAQHVHGVARLEVAIDGSKAVLVLTVPMEDAIGFERAPRNSAEKARVDDVLAKLGTANARLYEPGGEARCTVASAEAKVEKVGGGGKHSEVVARHAVDCANAAALRSIAVHAFDVLERVKRIDAQVAGPRGQAKGRLTASKRELAW